MISSWDTGDVVILPLGILIFMNGVNSWLASSLTRSLRNIPTQDHRYISSNYSQYLPTTNTGTRLKYLLSPPHCPLIEKTSLVEVLLKTFNTGCWRVSLFVAQVTVSTMLMIRRSFEFTTIQRGWPVKEVFWLTSLLCDFPWGIEIRTTSRVQEMSVNERHVSFPTLSTMEYTHH